MAESATLPDRWPPIEFYRNSLACVVCFVVAAAAFVSAIFLFAYCVPVTDAGGSVCVPPHSVAATIITIGGALVLILGVLYGVAAWLCLEPARYRKVLHALYSSGSESAPQPPPDAGGSAPPP